MTTGMLRLMFDRSVEYDVENGVDVFTNTIIVPIVLYLPRSILEGQSAKR